MAGFWNSFLYIQDFSLIHLAFSSLNPIRTFSSLDDGWIGGIVRVRQRTLQQLCSDANDAHTGCLLLGPDGRRMEFWVQTSMPSLYDRLFP